MANNNNKWAVPGWPHATKKDVYASYEYEVRQAKKRLDDMGLPYLKLVLPDTKPTSGYNAWLRVQELKKINNLDIVNANGKYYGTIGKPSKYLYVQESVTKEIKGHKWSKDYKMFTASDANKLLVEQNKTNKARKKQGLEPISGLKFNKEESVDSILRKIKFKGSDLGIGTEQRKFVDNILKSLKSAMQQAIDTGLYTQETIETINKLLESINNETASNNYKKLWSIYKASNDKELYNIFSSDQTLFQSTTLIDKLAEAYNIKINIDFDFSSEDVNF